MEVALNFKYGDSNNESLNLENMNPLNKEENLSNLNINKYGISLKDEHKNKIKKPG